MSLTNSEKIVKAIQTINPNAKVIVGDSIDKITWVEDKLQYQQQIYKLS